MRRLWILVALLLGCLGGVTVVAAQERDRDWDDCGVGREDPERVICKSRYFI